MGQHCFDSELTGKYVGTPRVEEVYLQKYVDQVIEGINTGYFMYVAHPDIINYVGDEEIYCKHMKRLAEELKRLEMPVELNVNGYREGRIYPNERFIKLAVEAGCEFIVGVDAHSPKELLDAENIEGCANLVKRNGGMLI